MKDKWKWIERGISIILLIGMFVSWRIDQTKWKTTVEGLIKSDEKQTQYIENQNEINGKFLILYDYFIVGSRQTKED